ncbi:hypothetical protein MPER_02353 [Moniliophthora perniciosa FA553]|nr:hypothetical protein MPER_02353 [Moniliophthora perniciosa FA553]
MRVGYVLPIPCADSIYENLQGSECQKAHWKTHKSECAILASERDTAKSVGLGDRYESLERWRRHRANGLRGPAVWALDAGLESDKSATHVLLVKLTIREDSKSRRNPWRLESARVVPDQLLKQTYGYDIEPQPDTVRILFIDQELSRHFSLHWEIKVNPEAEGRLRKMIWSDAECDWVDWAANLVQYGTNRPDRPAEIDSYLSLKRYPSQKL